MRGRPPGLEAGEIKKKNKKPKAGHQLRLFVFLLPSGSKSACSAARFLASNRYDEIIYPVHISFPPIVLLPLAIDFLNVLQWNPPTMMPREAFVMNCKKEHMQMFIDWLHAPKEYMFDNAVVAGVNISGGGILDMFAMGFLHFMPSHIIGQPISPDRPGKKIADYFQGNLINTIEGDTHTHMTILLAEREIEIYLQNVKDRHIETIRMTPAPCETAGNTMRIRTEGDDGLTYELRLSARKVLALPHQMIR